jgi:ComEC/Rec2-related protein
MVTKHPLLRPAIAMALGIVLASLLTLDWRLGFASAALSGFTACVLKNHRVLLGCAFWFFFGASLLSFRYAPRDPTDLRHIIGDRPELVTIVGILSDDPEHRVLEQERRTRSRTTARISVEQIKRDENLIATVGDVAISTTGFTSDDFVSGARVEIQGVIERPRGPLAPGLFDFEHYLKWQRIFFVLRAENTNDWKLLQPAKGWSSAALYRNFNNWARRTLQRGIPEDENTRLLWAMALGWRPGLTNEVAAPFQRTGTLHIFAISGLHIAMIAAILVKTLQILRVPRNWAGSIAIPIIWFYTGATGWQASAIRSTIMSSVIIIGWILKRPNNLLNSLAASGLLIFLWQPEQLFQPGFQLSFLLLLSFAVWPGMSPNTPWPDPSIYLGHAEPEEFEFKPHINAWTKLLATIFEKLTGRDPMLPADLRPKWRQRLDPAAIWLLNGINISLASLAGSLPVIAQYFNLISFSSVFANLVIVPTSGIALGCSMGSLVLWWIPFASEALNWVSWGTMYFMVWFCRALEHFRWTYEYIKAPGAIVIAAYYVGFLTILKGYKRIAIAAFAIVVAIPLWKEATTTSVTLLPGSGVVFIDAPWWKNDLLIDCGRDHEAATIVKPFLRSRGVDQLPGIVLTHGDVAHVEGYKRLAEEFDPQITYTSAARSRSPKYREILRLLDANRSKRKIVAAGDVIAGWKVMHPKRDEDFARADDEAIVLSKEIAGEKALLLSELGRLGQQALVACGEGLKSDVVFAGSPTDGQPLRPELLEVIKPKVVVFAGSDAKSQRALRDLRTRATNVVTTIDERAVTLTARRGKVVLETISGNHIELR